MKNKKNKKEYTQEEFDRRFELGIEAGRKQLQEELRDLLGIEVYAYSQLESN